MSFILRDEISPNNVLLIYILVEAFRDQVKSTYFTVYKICMLTKLFGPF